MGLAKTAEDVKPKTVSQPEPVNVESAFIYDGIPIDIARYFNEDVFNLPNKEKDKVVDIYNWAKERVGSEGTLGDVMMRISTLERQLGSPALGEKRYDKMWNWVKLSFNIEDLDKRRKALERRFF